MKSVKRKVNGKINLGLNVCGREGEFHSLDTVVVAIDLNDSVTVRPRRDKRITLNVRGYGAYIPEADNNVYRTVARFMETYGTNGADVTLEKNIPVGSGLGGSSADIVAAALAMADAYETEEQPLPLIRSLSSDGEFLLGGGAAVLTGRGSVAKRFALANPLYILIAIPQDSVSTADVFKEFDKGGYPAVGFDSQAMEGALQTDISAYGKREVFNALYAPCAALNPRVAKLYGQLLSLGPRLVSMSGSGSAVYAVYDTPELCAWAASKLGVDVIKFCIKTAGENPPWGGRA